MQITDRITITNEDNMELMARYFSDFIRNKDWFYGI